MKTNLFNITFLSFFLVVLSQPESRLLAGEIEFPQESAIEYFVKSKLPPHIKFSTMKLKNPKVYRKTLTYSGTVTGTLGEHLYSDVTDEIPEIANAPKTAIEPPMILKKLHGAGEIVEIPLEIQFRNTKDQWEPESVEDHQKFAELGKVKNDFKFTAVVFGTSDAKRLINQYLKDVQKAPVLKNKPAPKTDNATSSGQTPSTSEANVSNPPSNEVKSADVAELEQTQESEKQLFKEFEKKFYKGENPKDTSLKSSEATIEKILRTTTKESDFKNYEHKYKDDLNALAENYTQAAREADFVSTTTNFRVKSMCEDFAESYKNFAKGNYGQARIFMERAKKKRDEIKDSLTK
jgi:hypothetical protein